MTLFEIVILGYIINLFMTIIGVVYYISKLSNEQSIGELTQIDNKNKKSRVQAGFWFPYGTLLERYLVHQEYKKFKAQGGTRLVDFIDYMMVPKEK